MEYQHLALILVAWIIGAGSPGPATLAISATSMAHGRRAGITIASGIVAGSATWGIAAGLGIGSLMLANAWLFELVRYFGAAYLLYLAVKSFNNAFSTVSVSKGNAADSNLFLRGMLLHLTNPKAILGWGSIYAIALPQGAHFLLVIELFFILIAASIIVFIGYGLLFSMKSVSEFYRQSRRWFELAFGVLFGAASLRLLTSKVEV